MADDPTFKAANTLANRLAVGAQILQQYPERVPVIVELDNQGANGLRITRKKFLSPRGISLTRFMMKVRQVVQGLDARENLVVYVESRRQIAGAMSMATVYNLERDPDGFLYILVSRM